MRTRQLMTKFAIAALIFTATACDGNAKKNINKTEATVQETEATMQVDDVLAQQKSLYNQEITFEGVCTHTCAHGATKIFLMGSDDTKTIRVEAAKLGAFDKNCVNNIMKVKGILREQRIDEAYLQQWEAQLKEQTAEKHGEGQAGCDSEMKARGETSNTVDERIADFRKKIEARQQAEGKAYLSFPFVEALSYDIQ